MSKIAIITGIAGQDGSYLAEFLLEKGYEVHGLVRGTSEDKNSELTNISHILDRLILHVGDVSDYPTIFNLIKEIQPDEVYHLATKHDLENSLENYFEIQRTNIDSTYFLLAAIREMKPDCRFFFASSSRVFGKAVFSPQNEETALNANSLYGISKVASMNLVKMYRDDYNVFACSGILYNHESPRRDPIFLPRKISSTVAKIKLGLVKELKLGNLDAKRDWGFAGDFVEAMWLMLQKESPEDYVIGTGKVHTVRDILDVAFGAVGLNWKDYVASDTNLVRSEEAMDAVADISKAKEKLGWEPKISFENFIKMMVQQDIKLFQKNNSIQKLTKNIK